MTLSQLDLNEASPADLVEVQLAQAAGRQLSDLLAPDSPAPVQFELKTPGQRDQSITVPRSAAQLLKTILKQFGEGESVTVICEQAELTTHQAARVLQVSRPFLIRQLEQGLIPYRKVGTHRRVLLRDLMTYKRSMEKNRLEALETLGELDQQLGLGY